MSVFDFFDGIYCLTANGREAIYDRACRELSRIGMVGVNKFDSTEIDKVNRPLLAKELPDYVDPNREEQRQLASACHLEIWKKAKADGLNTVLIIEDDTTSIDWDDDVLQAAIDNLPTTWRMLWIGYNYRDKHQAVERVSDHLVRFPRGANVTSSNMYAINGKYIDEFLTYKPLQENRLFVVIDVWLQRMSRESYGVVPLMSAQDQEWKGRNKKDIFTENAHNMTTTDKAGKKIISFCLYGDDNAYYDGCIENASLVYPGWICRFYISQHVPDDFADRLRSLGAEVIRKESKGEHDGSLWRFLPVSDPDVDIMISRDADARLGDRDMFIIDEWLESGKAVHVIRDHPSHAMPILAGLWGYRGTLRKFSESVEAWPETKFGTDQTFLAHFYNEIKDETFVHSDYVQYPGEKVHPIKMSRGGDVWLGMPHGRCECRVAVFRQLRDRPLTETKNGLV